MIAQHSCTEERCTAYLEDLHERIADRFARSGAETEPNDISADYLTRSDAKTVGRWPRRWARTGQEECSIYSTMPAGMPTGYPRIYESTSWSISASPIEDYPKRICILAFNLPDGC